MAFPKKIGPSRPVFVGTCLCVSHPLLSGHTCCRPASSKALRKEGLILSLGECLEVTILKGSGKPADRLAEICHGVGNPSPLAYPILWFSLGLARVAGLGLAASFRACFCLVCRIWREGCPRFNLYNQQRNETLLENQASTILPLQPCQKNGSSETGTCEHELCVCKMRHITHRHKDGRKTQRSS